MSNKQVRYTQCKLIRKSVKDSGIITSTAWIPSTLAVKGKVLEIKAGDDWQVGWKVLEVFSTVDKEYLDEQHKSYKGFHDVLETHC